VSRRTSAAFLVASLSLIIIPDPAAHAVATSPTDVRIVFARLQESAPENYEIWTMDGTGRNQVRLTYNAVADHDPDWSPDGTKIAWVHFETQFNGTGPSDVWIMNADGSNKYRLTHDRADITNPSWSPNGHRIAFTRDYKIYVINVDGTGEHQISQAGAFDFDPAWSPDGSTIVFAHQFPTGGLDLATMRPDGSHLRRLTHTRAFEEDPEWSPDGQQVAFSGYDTRTGWHVYIVDRDGTDPTVLMERESLEPGWFPDGSRLALYACVDDCGLYQIRANGHGLRPLGRIRGFSDIQPDITAG
jgi:Tol biopolymer transport system component